MLLLESKFGRRHLLEGLGLVAVGALGLKYGDDVRTTLTQAESMVEGYPSNVVVFADDSEPPMITAVGWNGVLTRGEDAAAVIQSSINSFDHGGTVTLLAGEYDLQRTVNVTANVRFDTLGGAVLYNALEGSAAPSVWMHPGSSSGWLVVEGNGKQGIRIGEDETQNNIDMGFISSSAGYAENRSSRDIFSVELLGYNTLFGHMRLFGGEYGLKLNGCSDVFGHSLLSVNGTTGIESDDGEHIYISNCDIDTARFRGITLNGTRDIRLSGSVWHNATGDKQYPEAGIVVGDRNEVRLADLNFSVSSCGMEGIKLNRISDSLLRVNVSNTPLSTPGRTIETGIVTTDNTASSVYVNGLIVEPGITTPLDAVGGTFGDIPGVTSIVKTHRASGDGKRTTFDIPHGLSILPGNTQVWAKTEGAAGEFYVRDVDETTIGISYLEPPPFGEENLVWGVSASQ